MFFPMQGECHVLESPHSGDQACIFFICFVFPSSRACCTGAGVAAGRGTRPKSAFAAPALAPLMEVPEDRKYIRAVRDARMRWRAAERAAHRELEYGTESDSMPGLATPSGTSSMSSDQEDMAATGLWAGLAKARRARRRERSAAKHQKRTRRTQKLEGVSTSKGAIHTTTTGKGLGASWDAFKRAIAATQMTTDFEAGKAPVVIERKQSAAQEKISPRQQELRTRAEMRRIGVACTKKLLTADQSSELRRQTVKKVQTFFIQDGEDGAALSVVDELIRRGRSELIPLHRADLTWAKYAGPWKRAQVFLRSAVEADGRIYCAATLRADSRYVTAAALWCFYTTTAATSVETMVGAIRMAMRVNNIPIEDDFMTSVVRSVARRQRAVPVRKRVNITFDEVTKIAKRYGSESASMAHLMIACAIVIGFTLLLRYSDLTVITIDVLYFSPEGVAVFIPRRKNRQEGGGSWLPLADTKRGHGAVAILRRLLAQMGHTVPDGFVGQIRVKRFLFRDIVPRGGYKFASVRHDEVTGDGRHPIARRAYGHYLTRFREALRVCCGYSRTEAMEFGTQSLRSGGDTHLFNNNIPQDIRMVIGQWRTPSVEEGYVRSMMSSRFEMMAAIGL